MPYIITPQQPHEGNASTSIGTRRAVATLEEARDELRGAIYTDDPVVGRVEGALYAAIDDLSESGGTVTLPDGTVIEVLPHSPEWLAMEVREVLPMLPSQARDRLSEIIDAYNAKQVMTAVKVTYGPYSLLVNLHDGRRMIIRRQDADHKRTVAFVDSLAEWDRFAAALESGADEVAAVHAIDAGCQS